MSVYVHSGVSLGPYLKSFEKLFAHPIIYNESYLASEGYIAYQNRMNVNAMEMVLDNGLFYEFVPFNDDNFDIDGNIKSNPHIITINNIEENKEYALLLSTSSGAWRYMIGDVIKFTSKQLNEIVITGRTKHFLSICGEHLSLDNMNRAIEMLEDEFNIEVREFAVAGIKHDRMFAHKWFLGCNEKIDPEIAKNKIDEYLKKLNDDYRVERIEAIKEVFLEILPAKIFSDWMKKRGKEGGANKFPRVLKNAQLNEWEEHLKEYKT